ncbi:MAG: GAF domain-containing sensor histidine kinase [Nitrosomonas sp.]|nr:GAF domain-containing sensor histidine kinase [Nitrosomonas sp.]OQW83939.1 MAG: hypothetical protein BVN30_04605 [Proteobacteria bacterium ST_bin16]TXI38745.1 MAG: GAF domain-containing sensor histidine kinase [Nitrosomonas sp.]
MDKMLVSNNLLKLLFEKIDKENDNLNESEFLEVLVQGLRGTLDIINASLWRANSFRHHDDIRKANNGNQYFTLLGCHGYTPDPGNIKEFVHGTNTGIFSTIYGQLVDKPYFEISLSKSDELRFLHTAPKRVKEFNLDHLIIVPMIDKKTTGYEWQGVLSLYVKPYGDKSRDALDSYIQSIKAIFRIGLQNIKRYHSAELIDKVIERFGDSKKIDRESGIRERNKDTASILYFLMIELRRYIAFDTCSIFMWDPTLHKLELKKSLASVFESNLDNKSQHKNPSYSAGEGKTGKVYQTGEPLIIDNIKTSNERNKFLFREKTQHELRSFMAVPIIHPARPLEVLGVIRLVNRLNHFNHDIVDYFGPDDYSLIKKFSSLLALHLEVEQSEKMRKAFVNHMEHEIAGPITSIKNDADRILQRKEQNRLQDWQLEENLKHIIETAGLLESITQNVRFTGKGSEDAPRAALYLEIIPVSFLKDILEPAREIVIPLLREHGFQPKKEIVFDGNDFRIYVDKEAFIQVFVNLFSNAIKYRNNDIRSAPLAAVTWTNDPNQSIQINVTDQGRGIARENKERVFDFGFREIETTQTNVRGLGIGLSVVKKIITDFHSTIDITSLKNPTNFCISLSTKLSGIGYNKEAKWREKNKVKSN